MIFMTTYACVAFIALEMWNVSQYVQFAINIFIIGLIVNLKMPRLSESDKNEAIRMFRGTDSVSKFHVVQHKHTGVLFRQTCPEILQAAGGHTKCWTFIQFLMDKKEEFLYKDFMLNYNVSLVFVLFLLFKFSLCLCLLNPSFLHLIKVIFLIQAPSGLITDKIYYPLLWPVGVF